MVTPVTIPLLLRGLHLPSPAYTSIRIATADALIETVTKGMPSNDKLALLTVLDLGAVILPLLELGRAGGNVRAENEIEMLRERIAKLLNGMGTELCKICEEVSLALYRPIGIVWRQADARGATRRPQVGKLKLRL